METDTNTGKTREPYWYNDTCRQRKQPWLPGTTLPFPPAAPEHQPQPDTPSALVNASSSGEPAASGDLTTTRQAGVT